MNYHSSTIQTFEDAQAANRLLVVNRYIMAGFIAAFMGWLWSRNLLNFDPSLIVFVLLPAIFFVNTAWWAVSKSIRLHPYHFFLQFFVDIGALFCIVYVSGGLYSNFLFLPLILLEASTIVSWRLTTTVFFTTLAGYLLFFFGPHFGILSMAPAFESFKLLGAVDRSYMNLMTYVMLGILVSVDGYYFVSEIKKRDVAIAKIKGDVMSRTIYSLCDSLTALHWVLERFDHGDAGNDPEVKENMRIVKEFKRETQKLIVDAIEASNNNFSPEAHPRAEFVDLCMLLREVVKEALPAAAAKKVTIKFIADSSCANMTMNIMTDRRRLKEVLFNLIDNAIKFNRKEGRVDVGLMVERGRVSVSIKDTGEGIPWSVREKLASTYRGKRGEWDVPGLGLGLYVVKKLLENISGTISIHAEEGVGSTVTVTLPYYESNK